MDQATPVQLHEVAKEALAYKTKRLYKWVMRQKTVPNIWDIYAENEKTVLDRAPNWCGLEFYFINYGRTESPGFTPAGNPPDHSMRKAMWYWGTDKERSFSLRHENVRYNLILISYIIAHLNSEDSGILEHYFDLAASEFIHAFLYACIENALPKGTHEFHNRQQFLRLWGYGEWDLMIFNASQCKHLEKAAEELARHKPKIGCEITDWIYGVDNMSTDELVQYGPALAVSLVNYYKAEEMEKHDAAVEQSASGLEVFMQTGMNFDTEAALAGVDFSKPLVSALLAPIEPEPEIDPEDVVTPPTNRQPWMDPFKGVGILKGNEMVDLVENCLSSLQLGISGGGST
jgi:hypothetical protein